MGNSQRLFGSLIAIALIVVLGIAAYFGVRQTFRWVAGLEGAFVNQMVLTLLAVILGGWLLSRALQKAAIRGEQVFRQEQRGEVYAELLECRRTPSDGDGRCERLQAAETSLALWAGAPVLAAYAKSKQRSEPGAAGESELELINAMRKELGLPALGESATHLAAVLPRSAP